MNDIIPFSIFIILLLLPISLIITFTGWYCVEKQRKPKVIILHIHKEDIPAFKIDEDDWKELMDNAEEIT